MRILLVKDQPDAAWMLAKGLRDHACPAPRLIHTRRDEGSPPDGRHLVFHRFHQFDKGHRGRRDLATPAPGITVFTEAIPAGPLHA